MKRIVQQDETDCGIACIAMLAGKSYKNVRDVAVNECDLEFKGELYTDTAALAGLGTKYKLEIGGRRLKFKEFEHLPDTALLVMDLHKENRKSYWHWAIFQRESGREFVLDPKKSIKSDKRTGLKRIEKSTSHWLPVTRIIGCE